MAAGKRNKNKKSAPQRQATPPPPPMDQDDSDLMNDLLAQLDSRDQVVKEETATILNEMKLGDKADAIEAAPKQDARSRFLARQARKTAKLAESYAPDNPEVQARLEREAKEEAETIERESNARSLTVYAINPDGHCLFSAIADQLVIRGLLPPEQANYATIRAVAANYIHSHPDDFLPFLPSTGGEDGAGALDAGMMNKAQFDQYCASIKGSAVWGGEPEIVALSRAFNIPIRVIQAEPPTIVEHSPDGTAVPPNSPALWISYHRRLFGLGEHYNSLRPITTAAVA